MNDNQISQTIADFINLVEKTCGKEYELASSEVNLRDKELQDLLHDLELNSHTYHEKAHIAVKLEENRVERRHYKNRVDLVQPLCELLEDGTFKKNIEKLKVILGKVRKAEAYLQDRTYKPRVLGSMLEKGSTNDKSKE